MKTAIATLFLLLLATHAGATGLPAPLQADYDIGATCQDARWSVYRYDGFSAPWIGATGWCRSYEGIFPVQWACNPLTGLRAVQRVGLDKDANGRPAFYVVNDFSPALTDRGLCE